MLRKKDAEKLHKLAEERACSENAVVRQLIVKAKVVEVIE